MGARDLADEPLRLLRPPHGGVAALPAPPPDAGEELLRSVAATELRRLGVAVDRRSLCLQPNWRSDRQAVEILATRPLGPAHVTLLELRGPLRAAAAHGCDSIAARAATTTLADDLRRAIELVARGRQPQLWLAALGTPVAVAHTLDVARLCRHIVGWPHAASLRLRVGNATAAITSDSHRAIATLARRLADSALGGAGVEPIRGGLRLLAPPCTAFGPRPVFARRSLGAECEAAAALPWLRHSDLALDLAGLGVRVTMAAAALAVDRRRPERQHPQQVPATQLLPLGQARDDEAPSMRLFELEPWDFSGVP